MIRVRIFSSINRKRKSHEKKRYDVENTSVPCEVEDPADDLSTRITLTEYYNITARKLYPPDGNTVQDTFTTVWLEWRCFE